MIQFDRYFYNIFDDKNITPARLGDFAHDHLEKLKAANPGGVYDAIIASTQALLKDFHVNKVDPGKVKASRKDKVVVKREARLIATNYIVQKEGLVKSAFGKKSAEYKEFFPGRINLFRHSTDEKFKELLGVLVLKAQKYEAVLGSDFKVEITALRDNYSEAKQLVSHVMGEILASKRTQRQVQSGLQHQLCINLCTIAMQNIGKPNAAKLYFSAHLLLPAKKQHLFKAKIEAGDKREVCTFKFSDSKRFHIMNTGAEPLNFQMTLNGMEVGRELAIKPKEKFNEPFGFFSSAGNALIVTNPGDKPGGYMVWEIS
jgi:hypothetical protein